LDSIHWVQGAVEKAGTHGSPHVHGLLKPVAIEQNESEQSLTELLEEGKIDALIGSRKPDTLGQGNIARLLPNFREIERQLYETRKFFPIMHLIAIRRDLYERNRWIATSLYKAFVESKRRARLRLRYAGSLAAMLPWLQSDIDEIDEVFGG